MLDSKNFLWLGSFITLLFITFCVTRHIDELNPQFQHISSTPSYQNASKQNGTEPDENIFVNEIIIEQEESDQKSKPASTNGSVTVVTVQKEESSKTQTSLQKESKSILHIEPKTTAEKNVSTQEAIKTEAQNTILKKDKDLSKAAKAKHVEIKKPTNTISTGEKRAKIKKRKSYRQLKTIAQISIDPYLELSAKDRESITMIAYKYGVYKKSFVIIKSGDIKKAKMLKRLLIKKNVEPAQIMIKKTNDEMISVLLKERI